MTAPRKATTSRKTTPAVKAAATTAKVTPITKNTHTIEHDGVTYEAPNLLELLETVPGTGWLITQALAGDQQAAAQLLVKAIEAMPARDPFKKALLAATPVTYTALTTIWQNGESLGK